MSCVVSAPEVEIGCIYGVHHTTLSKWKHQFLDNGAEVFGGNEEVVAQREEGSASLSACSARKRSSSPC
jgi:transposase-like protein